MKIAIIGNAAGGKTTLSRSLANIYSLKILHIDSHQFVPPMNIAPMDQTRSIISGFMNSHTSWIIDGHGPLDTLIPRLNEATHVIFIDLPLGTHVAWFLKRQFKNLWSQRQELPAGCKEASFRHTIKVLKHIKSLNKQMRPELHRILSKPEFKQKTLIIKNPSHLKQVARKGL